MTLTYFSTQTKLGEGEQNELGEGEQNKLGEGEPY
jgi:hypothetical protein